MQWALFKVSLPSVVFCRAKPGFLAFKSIHVLSFEAKIILKHRRFLNCTAVETPRLFKHKPFCLHLLFTRWTKSVTHIVLVRSDISTNARYRFLHRFLHRQKYTKAFWRKITFVSNCCKGSKQLLCFNFFAFLHLSRWFFFKVLFVFKIWSIKISCTF